MSIGERNGETGTLVQATHDSAVYDLAEVQMRGYKLEDLSVFLCSSDSSTEETEKLVEMRVDEESPTKRVIMYAEDKEND